MSAPLHHLFTKDLYKLLLLPRTATQNEIKQSYRKIALTLHPDKHDGCDIKTSAFKEVSEAYRILSQHRKRVEYDRWLDDGGHDGSVSGSKKGMSRAAERNPFYRKVYSPAAPPGMKTFDRQRHFDMHYGQGMMKEEIERARKRAQAASPRHNNNSYQSPLGSGFTFDKQKPMGEQMNPYSRKGKAQHDHIQNHNDKFQIKYEESYFDMSGSDLSGAGAGKEFVVERMNRRRKNRRRERGDPQPYQNRRRAGGGEGENDAESSGCVIM